MLDLQLFETLLHHLNLDQIFEKLLGLISAWHQHLSAEIQDQYAEIVLSKIDQFPHNVAFHLPQIWSLVSKQRSIETIIRLYNIDTDTDPLIKAPLIPGVLFKNENLSLYPLLLRMKCSILYVERGQ